MSDLPRATLYVGLFILLSALLLAGGAAQTTTVNEITNISCQDGYAFWAQESAGPQNYETVLWSGSQNVFQGRFRSNGAINISGSNNRVTGAVEYGSTFVDSGDNNQFGSTVEVLPAPVPVVYDLDDYLPGGVIAQQAQAEGRYHLISNKLEVREQGTRLDGLYYVQGKVEISASDVHGTFTIVTTGKIEISGSGLDFDPYADGLLFFTSTGGERNFTVSGSGSIMEGVIYAPNVGLELSGTSNSFRGGIYVGEGKFPGSSLDVRFDSSHCPQQSDQTSTPPSPRPTDTPPPPPSSTVTQTPPSSPTPSLTPTIPVTGTPDPSPTPTVTASPQPTAENGIYMPLAMVLAYRGPGEPNNSCPQAYELTAGLPQQFLAEDRDDWYTVELPAGGNITVQLANFVPRLGQVALYRGESCGDLIFLRNNGDTATMKTITLNDQPPGRYYVYVSNDGDLNILDLYELLIRVDGP